MYCGKFTIASKDVEGLYNLKELVFGIDCLTGELAHSGASISTKHLVLVLQAPCTNTTSTLYRHYKHLVQALQASCTDTTKYLVLALLSACSDCTEDFSQHCKCMLCANSG